MDKNEQKPFGDDNDPPGNYAKYTGIAFQMFAIIGVFAFIGYEIDKAYNHSTKWVTAILSLTGIMISLYIVIKSLKN
jgi:F0F1-type ATP synthase assembly protein I